MAEQGAAQGARQAEPNAQVVRCLESRAAAVKLWAAAVGIPVVDREGTPVATPDLARAVATGRNDLNCQSLEKSNLGGN